MNTILANTFAQTSNGYQQSLIEAANTERVIDMVRTGQLVILRSAQGSDVIIGADHLPKVQAGLLYPGFVPQVDTHEAEAMFLEHIAMLMGCWN